MSAMMSEWDRLPVTQRLNQCNPMHGNPLKTRGDLCKAVLDFYKPLKPYYSDGQARLRLGVGAAHFDEDAAEMEAFVRPLWGLVPLIAGGFEFSDVDRFVTGLTNGTDPSHPDYWGDVGPRDQRMVEMAGIALALLLAPQTFWEPLTNEAKDRAEKWFLSINQDDIPDNNWLFFRILMNLALRKVGRQWSEPLVRAGLDRIESFYLGAGYYRDGEWKQRDYYLPMALHFYGLMLCVVGDDLFPEYCNRYRERARLFATDFQHWFADDGAAIPFGRSLTYRFAQGAFWAACAFAGEDVLPWGQIKGHLLRHLRWWSNQPICERDGILSIGYSYPNLLVSEAYNAPGSPYWALKIFLVLALPDTHPFWAAEEEAMPPAPAEPILAQAAGFAMQRSCGDAVILTGGQDGHEHRAYDAKYARFAYSSAFSFSVKSDATVPDYPDRSAVDSGLMISFDGKSWISRGHITEAGIRDGMVWGAWQPDEAVRIETWLAFAGAGWHMRLHKIVTSSPIWMAESGFSIDRSGERSGGLSIALQPEAGEAIIKNRDATSALFDVTGGREAHYVKASPNTNLRFPRSGFPRLEGAMPQGEHLILTKVFATPSALDALPDCTPPEEMLALMRQLGL